MKGRTTSRDKSLGGQMGCLVCETIARHLHEHYETLSRDLYDAELMVLDQLSERIEQLDEQATRLRAICCCQVLHVCLLDRSYKDLVEPLRARWWPDIDGVAKFKAALNEQLDFKLIRGLELKLLSDRSLELSKEYLNDLVTKKLWSTLIDVVVPLERVVQWRHTEADIRDIANKYSSAIVSVLPPSKANALLNVVMSITTEQTVDVWNTIPDYLA